MICTFKITFKYCFISDYVFKFDNISTIKLLFSQNLFNSAVYLTEFKFVLVRYNASHILIPFSMMTS